MPRTLDSRSAIRLTDDREQFAHEHANQLWLLTGFFVLMVTAFVGFIGYSSTLP